MFEFFTKRWVSRKEYDDRVQKFHDFIKQQEKSFEQQISILEGDHDRRMNEYINFHEQEMNNEYENGDRLKGELDEALANLKIVVKKELEANLALKELIETNLHLDKVQKILFEEIEDLGKKLTAEKGKNTKLRNKLKKEKENAI